MAPHMTSWLQRQLGVGADALAQLPRVYLHTRLLDDATYRRLYVSADCVVMPTRGEGWGRPQMEAMAMARPLITTNWCAGSVSVRVACWHACCLLG
jgi:glycosyltransferase involved in cell wall biosynthesis